jgi:hypothetical protein
MANMKVSKYKNLVLDLDSTIVHTREINNILNDISLNHPDIHNKIGIFKIKSVKDNNDINLWTIYRSHLAEFLEFSAQYFDNILIWSAGQYNYVHKIVELLFKNISKKPTIIYTQENCIINGNTIHKPLDNLFKDIRLKNVNITNTLVVDDRPDTFSRNPYNGILIPPFEPETIEDIKNDDPVLLQIMGWLVKNNVQQCDDVRNINKEDIFVTSVEEYLKIILQK